MSEYPDCYGHKERTARKAHRCCECHGTIQLGEKYHYHHGVWDGEAASYKVCVDCEALRTDLDLGHECCDRPPLEGLEEAIGAECHNIPELLVRFVEIKRRRGATVLNWMAEMAGVQAYGGGEG